MKRLLVVTSLCFAVLSGAHAQEAIPKTISYTGYLTDPPGVAVVDDDYTITFRLYEQATGGGAVWSVSHTVTTSRGHFSVVLGKIESLDEVPFDRSYHLGISIGAGDELIPRTELVPVPYVHHALTVKKDAIGKQELAGNTVDGSKIEDGTIAAADLAADAVDGSKIKEGWYGSRCRPRG